MVDDINKLPISASSKRFARKHGLKDMMSTHKYDKMVADVTNQGSSKFKIKTVGKVLSTKAKAESIKAQAHLLVRRLLK